MCVGWCARVCGSVCVDVCVVIFDDNIYPWGNKLSNLVASKSLILITQFNLV